MEVKMGTAIKESPGEVEAELRSEIMDLKGEVSFLRSENSEQARELEDLKKASRSVDEMADAIDDLLDCVERPTGTLKAILPQNAASERALVALYDATGRAL